MIRLRSKSDYLEVQRIMGRTLAVFHSDVYFLCFTVFGLNIFISLYKYNIQYMKTYMMKRIRTKANSLKDSFPFEMYNIIV